MRIIAGNYKNRKLCVPEDDSVRPTSARMREAMFNILMHGEFGGDQIIDGRVADICCGTGALGLEALSRGAAHCSFVDSSKQVLKLAEKNAYHLGAQAQCEFLHHDATKLTHAATPFDVVFADPPYDKPLLARMVDELKTKNWLKDGSLLVCELPAFGIEAPVFSHMDCLLNRKYGKAALYVWRATSD